VIEEAIANTLEVADKVEEYTGILGQPRIPDFPIPEGTTALKTTWPMWPARGW
jgi:DNA polymerase-3 subunit alpha